MHSVDVIKETQSDLESERGGEERKGKRRAYFPLKLTKNLVIKTKHKKNKIYEKVQNFPSLHFLTRPTLSNLRKIFGYKSTFNSESGPNNINVVFQHSNELEDKMNITLGRR